MDALQHEAVVEVAQETDGAMEDAAPSLHAGTAEEAALVLHSNPLGIWATILEAVDVDVDVLVEVVASVDHSAELAGETPGNEDFLDFYD